MNDIAVEGGNSLYQPILDRYIAGEDVPFNEVRKVWRNTTQPTCSRSDFFEQLFSLVGRINQKLASARRLRMLAGDRPSTGIKSRTSRTLRKSISSDEDIVRSAENPTLEIPEPRDAKAITLGCLSRKKQSATPK